MTNVVSGLPVEKLIFHSVSSYPNSSTVIYHCPLVYERQDELYICHFPLSELEYIAVSHDARECRRYSLYICR